MRKITRLPSGVRHQPIYNPSVNRVLSNNNRRERNVPSKPIVDVDIYTEINHKILPPNYLNKKFSLYVESSTYTHINVENILKTINYQEYDLIVFKSSKINCIYKDAFISNKLYFDVSENITKQMQDYKADGYPENNELLETDIIFRSKTETMSLVNNLWLKEMQKYKGTPDVYGFNYAVFKFKPKCLIL